MPDNFSPHSYEGYDDLLALADRIEDAKEEVPILISLLGAQRLRKVVEEAKRSRGPKSGWIDCDDRMPESGDEVLVYHVLGDRSGAPMTIDIATWGNSKKWIYPWDRGGINPTPWLVTHWHPLPSIPATGSETTKE